MGNIYTYLEWRGDVLLSERGFNDVDNLVLCEMSYVKLAGIVPDMKSDLTITVREAAQCHEQKFPGQERTILQRMAESPRFANAKLFGLEEQFEEEGDAQQFMAVSVLLDDGTIYVVFRGTDKTLVGWREDFALGYEIVPAQKTAAEYLKKVMRKQPGLYLVGGHSKGGNLAAYAVMMCEEEDRQRVLQIYSNDGPGLCKELIPQDRYAEIQDKIKKIVPEFSVFGALFEDRKPDYIVKSDRTGIMQHYTNSWQVQGDHFVSCECNDKESEFYNKLLAEWMGKVDMKEREIFVRDFFDALGAGGSVTLDDLTKGGIPKWESILVNMGKSEKTAKHTFIRFLESAWRNIQTVSFTQVLQEKQTIPGIIAFVLGILFLMLPTYSLHLLGTVFFIVVLVYAIYRVYNMEKTRRQGERIGKKEIAYSLLAGVTVFCILFNNIAVLVTNLTMGFFFEFRAYRQGEKGIRLFAVKDKWWLPNILDAVMSFGLGILSLISLIKVDTDVILVLGTYLILLGIAQFLRIIWSKVEKQ